MTRLLAAFLLLCALGFAALAVIRARPRWRWDVGMSDTNRHGGILWYIPDCGYLHAGAPGQWTIPAHCPDGVPHWTTGSPESVTWSTDNGEGLFI